jgi:hypothetical protein
VEHGDVIERDVAQGERKMGEEVGAGGRAVRRGEYGGGAQDEGFEAGARGKSEVQIAGGGKGGMNCRWENQSSQGRGATRRTS